MGMFPYECNKCRGTYNSCGRKDPQCFYKGNGGQFCWEEELLLLLLPNKGFLDQMKIIESTYDGYGRIYLSEENILSENLKWEDFCFSIKKDSVFDLSTREMNDITLLELNEYDTRKREVTQIYCKSCYYK
jgi:hypothetical protein